MSQSIIGGFLVAIIGVLLLINPHGVWKATERWKQMNAAEASKAFLSVTRIVGAALVIVGFLVCAGLLK